MIPVLYNTPIDDESWRFFGATHQSDHLGIADQIFQKTQRRVPVLPLDPLPLHDPGAMLIWFQNHQAMHTAMNAAMGTGGSDLSFVDFSNPEQITFWIQYNAAEHMQIAEAISRYRPPPPPQQQQQSQPVMPQPLVVLQPQAGGVLPQGGVPIFGQPLTGTQVQPQGGPAAPLQPPTLQPQPGLAPQQPLRP